MHTAGEEKRRDNKTVRRKLVIWLAIDRKNPFTYQLEQEVATYSSILARIIPWTEKPVGYSLWSWKELDMTEVTE